MTKIQFRVLYREFLFRVVDLELLAPQGDIAKLLGQFAAALLFLSFALAYRAMFVNASSLPPQRLLAIVWEREHTLIATTMLAVGLFAVLSWDSAFLDRRDVMVLAPLPVRPRTLLFAKIAALATALSLTILALNALTGLAWPIVFAGANSGFGDVIRSLAAYWTTMIAAGVFILGSVLGLHGLAAQLPRRRYLRVSALLQMAVFCLLLSVYFLQPTPVTIRGVAALESRHLLEWLPSYWFFGLFQVLNGSVPAEIHATIFTLARRAAGGLAIASIGAGTAFLLSYFRTLRKIVEEPDIVPGSGGFHWLPRFGNSVTTAIVHFSIRTLLRSRQHRVILAFYLGVGFAIVILFMQAPAPRQQASTSSASPATLIATMLMLFCAVAGTRIVFAMPLQLKANWIFRVTPLPGPRKLLNGIRRSLLVLSVAPIWAASAVALLSAWPWRIAAGHLIALGFLGMILADGCLSGFQKIPFTCSYLPGKSQAHKGLITVWITLFIALTAVEFERSVLDRPAGFALMIAILCVAAACARWWSVRRASLPEATLLFEEAEAPAIFALDLHRDGRFQA
jgi:hypothetical protein